MLAYTGVAQSLQALPGPVVLQAPSISAGEHLRLLSVERRGLEVHYVIKVII